MKIDWKKEIKLPRPSLSWLRRGPSVSVKKPSLKAPSLKGSSLKRPKALSAGPSVKLPRAVTDVYADLRDRHLLPLVALLIVGIVAAPILLNKGSDSTTRPPVAATGVSGTATSSSSFTVVPAARRLRSPGKRLGHRQPLDPFRVEQQKQTSHRSNPGTQGGTTGGAATGETVTSTVPAESTQVAGATAATATQPSQPTEIKVTETAAGDKETTIKESNSIPSSGTEASSSGGSSGASPEGTSTTEATGGQTEVVGYAVDLKTGDPEGELTEQNEVAPMTKLPTAKNPLVVLVGLSQDNKRALFLMTSKVTAYYGAVHCVVDAQACQLVELKPGKAALFEYISGETEAKYKVVLEKIEPVVSSQGKTAGSTVSERPAGAQPQHPSPRAYALGTARRFSK